DDFLGTSIVVRHCLGRWAHASRQRERQQCTRRLQYIGGRQGSLIYTDKTGSRSEVQEMYDIGSGQDRTRLDTVLCSVGIDLNRRRPSVYARAPLVINPGICVGDLCVYTVVEGDNLSGRSDHQ